MRDHRTGPAPEGLPERGSVEYHAERLVLFELISSPPAEGDEIEPMGDILELSPRETRAAADALVRQGLAVLDGTVVRAHSRALYFDHLLRVSLSRG